MPPLRMHPHWDALVVDDEEGIRELLVSYFSSRGLTVTGAPDGRAAIAALERSNGRYGLVVTDLNLPGADGFAVLQAARQANPDCYVVIVTGHASLDSAVYAVRVGAYDYLTKPFSLGQLDVILKRIAERVTLDQANREPLQKPPMVSVNPSGAFESKLNSARIEAVLSRIEKSLARLEARMDQMSGVPSIRR